MKSYAFTRITLCRNESINGRYNFAFDAILNKSSEMFNAFTNRVYFKALDDLFPSFLYEFVSQRIDKTIIEGIVKGFKSDGISNMLLKSQ